MATKLLVSVLTVALPHGGAGKAATRERTKRNQNKDNKKQNP
jgi:hypothetical protein